MNTTTNHTNRTRPPVSAPPSTLPFAPPAPTPLQNGLPVYVVHDGRLPYVTLQLVLRSGACHDGSLPGLAELTSSMLLSGSGGRDAEAFAGDVEFLGASLDAGAGHEDTIVRLETLKEQLPAALDLLADMTLRPHFAPDETERQRRQSIAVLKQNLADPGYLAITAFRRQLYGTWSYGTRVDGTVQALNAIRRQDIVDFHRTHFTPDNGFVVASGDVDAGELAGLLNQRFGQWNGPAPAGHQLPDGTQNRRRVVLVHKPGATQSSIVIGGFGIARRDPDYTALVAANTIFGGYFNSRINLNLREQHGYTYGARSVTETPKGTGIFAVNASVGADVTALAIEQIVGELDVMSSQPVSDEELETVKSYVSGGMALQMETAGQMARAVRHIVFHQLPADYYDQFVRQVSALTKDDILRVAGRLMRPEQMLITVAGDATKVRSALEQFGPVERFSIYDL